MFLVNSRFPLVSAAPSGSGRESFTLTRPSFSRSYGGILPSSLTTVLSIALVFSTRPPELVWGTGTVPTNNDAFLGSMGSVTSPESARHHVSGCMRPGFTWSSPYTLTPNDQLWGSPTLLRPAGAARIRSVGSPEGSPLVPRIGIGADTVVPEYQPVVHRLRLSASP